MCLQASHVSLASPAVGNLDALDIAVGHEHFEKGHLPDAIHIHFEDIA
jgi:hypothetical protein